MNPSPSMRVTRAHPESGFGKRWKARAIAVDIHGVLIFITVGGLPLSIQQTEKFESLYAQFLDQPKKP